MNGDADEEEFNLCETLLEGGSTVIDEDRIREGDPLVASLRAQRAPQGDGDASTDELVQRIERIAMRQSIGRDDLERLVDRPHQADELGRIGKYRVIEFIAAGGMGLVFKAEDTELNRLVCIKVMHPALALKSDAKLRFERESRAAARLRSERIVTLLDIGVQRDLPYIVMQLLDGESLRSKLAREGRISPELAVQYVMQMAEGLRHAHALGILHRDIKPDNIWITPEGDVKLLDFGLAQPLDEAGNLTTTGGLVGTPQYMSPEQIQGQSLDARSDLFSVGVVLFEMLTGNLPFQKNNLFSTMIAITNDSVSLPASDSASHIDTELENIVHGLLKKNADERIPSASELIERLGNLGSARSASFSPTVHRAALSGVGSQRDRAARVPYVLSGLIGGLCTMLLGIALVQTTNKGTLIIRSDDPEVEVQIAREKVTIKDPLTGRSFEVQVGKTTLPGGVYQLQVNDAVSGLTLSSSTVAIRRGETVIVEVELQPVTKVESNQPTEKDASVALPAKAAATEADASADPSFDSRAREDFAHILDRLPALTAATDAAAMSVNQRESSSARQPKLLGIDSWSIDTNDIAAGGLSRNSNGTLFAASRGNSVQIWDTSLKLKYTLPLARSAGRALFDNKYPNLIAVSCYTKGPGEPEMLDEPSYELVVWRLGADYAEVIYRIPCRSYSFAWDQGYRLFHVAKEGVAAFRLDQGKAYGLHGPDDTILQNAISTSGRYMATGNKQNIDIWDLKRGEFAFTALGTHRAQWNQQGDRVAFFAAQRPAFEIWDLELRTINDKVDLPVEPAGADRSRMNIAAIGLEPTFQRVAWLSPQGTLTVRNLQTNREDSQDLSAESKNKVREATIEWERSSFKVETDQATFVWTHDKSDVEGILKKKEVSPLYATKQGGQLLFSRVLGSTTPVLCWNDAGASERNSNRPYNSRDRENELYFDAFDITLNKFYRESPLAATRAALYWNVGRLSNILGPPFFSHDGKYATGPLPPPTTGSGPPNRGEVGFYSLVSSAPPEKLIAPSPTTLWDKTSRFAFFVENTVRSGNAKFLIYDTEINQFIDEQNFGKPTGRLIELQPCKQGFVACLRVDRPATQAAVPNTRTPTPKYSGDLEVWVIDPAKQEARKATAATTLLAKVIAIESISVTDRHLFVSSLGRVDTFEDQATVKKVYRIAIDEIGGGNVECVTVPVIDELLFSASGEYLLREARDVEITSLVDSAFGRSRSGNVRGPSELSVARWSEVAQDLGNVDALEKQVASETTNWSAVTPFKQLLTSSRSNSFRNLRWHPAVDVAAWIDGGYPNFFGADKRELRTHSALARWSDVALSSTDRGWSSIEGNEIRFIDLAGSPIGRLIFDPMLANMKPANPRWILADGSLLSRCSTSGLAITYLRDNRFYCEAVEDFERARPDVKLPRSDHIPGMEP